MQWISRATRWTAAFAAVAAMAFAGCGSSDDGDAKTDGGSDTGSASAPSARGLKVGVANLGLSFPFTAGIGRGIKAEADELGVEITELDAQGKADKQSSDVQDLIAGQNDGVLLIPVDGGVSVGQVKQLKAAGIPVVAISSQVGDPRTIGATEVYPDLAAWVAQDEIKAGEQAGSIALEVLPEGGKTAVVEGAAGFSSVRLRSEGFRKGLGDSASSYEIVASQPGDWLPDRAEAACQNMLASDPDIALFYAQSDDMAVGCANAVKAAGSKAKIVGIGGSKLGLDAIRSGAVAGTVCYEPEDTGRLALRTLVKHLTDDSVADAEFVESPAPAITRANLDECDPQW